jgi:hypothetical protein
MNNKKLLAMALLIVSSANAMDGTPNIPVKASGTITAFRNIADQSPYPYRPHSKVDTNPSPDMGGLSKGDDRPSNVGVKTARPSSVSFSLKKDRGRTQKIVAQSTTKTPTPKQIDSSDDAAYDKAYEKAYTEIYADVNNMHRIFKMSMQKSSTNRRTKSLNSKRH